MRLLYFTGLCLLFVAGCAPKATPPRAALSVPAMSTTAPVVTMKLAPGNRMEIVALQNSFRSPDPTAKYQLVEAPKGETGLELSQNGVVMKTWVLTGAKNVELKAADPDNAKGDEQVLKWTQAGGKEDLVVTMGVPSWYGSVHPVGKDENVTFAKMVPSGAKK